MVDRNPRVSNRYPHKRGSDLCVHHAFPVTGSEYRYRTKCPAERPWAETKTPQTASRHRIHRNLDRIALNLRLLERKERRLGAIQPWRSGLSDYLVTHWTRQPRIHWSGSGGRRWFRIGPGK